MAQRPRRQYHVRTPIRHSANSLYLILSQDVISMKGVVNVNWIPHIIGTVLYTEVIPVNMVIGHTKYTKVALRCYCTVYCDIATRQPTLHYTTGPLTGPNGLYYVIVVDSHISRRCLRTALKPELIWGASSNRR